MCKTEHYLDKLQVCESTHGEVWYVLEGGAWDLRDAPADGGAFRRALSAAQRCRAVEVAPVWWRTKLWGWQKKSVREPIEKKQRMHTHTYVKINKSTQRNNSDKTMWIVKKWRKPTDADGVDGETGMKTLQCNHRQTAHIIYVHVNITHVLWSLGWWFHDVMRWGECVIGAFGGWDGTVRAQRRKISDWLVLGISGRVTKEKEGIPWYFTRVKRERECRRWSSVGRVKARGTGEKICA